VAYGSCSEANPAWLVSYISRVLRGSGDKTLGILIGIWKRSYWTDLPPVFCTISLLRVEPQFSIK
jgi:hypothetical protein